MTQIREDVFCYNKFIMTGSVELSGREQEILRLVATGASNKEIALQLRISPNTVKVHLRNIFAKVDVMSRTEATLYAIRHGLAPAPTHLPTGTAEDSPASPPPTMPGVRNAEIETLAPISVSRLDETPDPSGHPTTTFLPAWLPANRLAWSAAVVVLALVIILAAVIITHNSRAALVASPTLPTVSQVAALLTPVIRWQTRPTLPQPRQGMAAAVYEEAIYLISGEGSAGVTGAVDRYTIGKNIWESRAAKPTPVADIQAVLLGEKIYVPGGRLASGLPTAVLEVYDPRRDQWEAKASLPVAISGYTLATFEGRLYLFGGWDGSAYLNSVYVYDPIQNLWMQRTALPQARAFAGAVAAEGKIYVIGGFDGQHALASNIAYYPDRDGSGESPWSERAPLQQGRYAMGVAGLLDSIYLVGGKTDAPTSQQSLQYSMQQDAWQVFDNPILPVGSSLAAAALQDQIIILGGRSNGNPSAQMQFYQAIYRVLMPGVQSSNP